MIDRSSPSRSRDPVKTFTVDRLSVRIYESVTELARDVALLSRDYLRDVLSDRETASVILATGNSQIEFLDVFVNSEGLDWSRIEFFHLDEYLGIDAAHPSSFRRYLRERVEKFIKPKRFYYIEGDALEPIEECERYTKLLQTRSIDLCCLGIGENGHLAFNEPSVADFHDPRLVKIVKLDIKNREQQVNNGHFLTVETVPQYAFTLTIPAIREARKILCLATGKRKTRAIEQMLGGKIDRNCPASILRETAGATLFLDIASAGSFY